jgi:hypothetical protein
MPAMAISAASARPSSFTRANRAAFAGHRRIPFTDFSLDEISLYFCNKTILLPSEY